MPKTPSFFFRRPTSARVGRDELGGEEDGPEGLLEIIVRVKAVDSAELDILVGEGVVYVGEGEEEGVMSSCNRVF